MSSAFTAPYLCPIGINLLASARNPGHDGVRKDRMSCATNYTTFSFTEDLMVLISFRESELSDFRFSVFKHSSL